MKRVWAIAKKEFSGYFNSLIAYIFSILFLGLVNTLYIWIILVPNKQLSLNSYFEFMLYGIWLIMPSVTMRAWAEEKKLGTDELLLSFPIKDWEAVAGKYLAGIMFLATLLALSVVVPLSTVLVGKPDWPVVVAGYLGLFLVGASFLAIGMMLSSATKSQTIAFIATLLLCLGLMGIDNVIGRVELPFGMTFLISYLDIGSHFDSISRGVIDSRDIVYYLSVIFFFLVLNKYWIERRKWA
jgi:ABC-2 type transport system permease protein